MKIDLGIYRGRQCVTVTVSRASLEVHRLANSMFTPPQNLSSFICLTITNLLCTRSIHIFAPALPPSLSSLLSPPLSPLFSNSARGHKSPFCCFSGLALLSSSSSSSWLTAGARPRLTFVISNPAGLAHNKERSKLSLRPNPTTPFLMALPSPSSPLFSLHYLSFRLLGGHSTSLIAT